NDQYYPVAVSSLTNVNAIAPGWNHTLFLKTDGTVWACGYNQFGELGDGTIIDKSTPVQVPGLCTASGVEEFYSDNIFVYPNPFTDQLTFSISGNRKTTLTFYDICSRPLLQQTFKNSIKINTEQFSNGIYFYELRNNKGILKTGKVIKQ
ncbi:MAG: T9SS type A sorting domain-containing protein, partial [Bacteroidota bacterium]